jgi:hypothetical protein
MKLWMDIMRELELVLTDYERLFDAWEAGGVDGLVLGPMTFSAARLLPCDGARYVNGDTPPVATFDPDPAVYQRFGVEAPPPPSDSAPEKRRLLDKMLLAAKKRSWSVLIFQANTGAGMGGTGPMIVDERSRAALSARMVDTLAHYPMVDGAVMDGPEWGYEIADYFYNRRSYIFDEVPEVLEPNCRALGFDYAALVEAKDRLFTRLHTLTPRQVQTWAGGGLLGSLGLLGDDPNLVAWMKYRRDSLTLFFKQVHQAVVAERSHALLGVGPRTAAFGSLCGYDFTQLAEFMDFLLPKHYFWHRGFDGLVGTVGRYLEVLTSWNKELSDADALAVIQALFGLNLPGVHDRRDLEEALTPAFCEQIVTVETHRALAAVEDPQRIVPWVDAGRAPHDGDPLSAGFLRQMLIAAQNAGLKRCLYHHAGNLTAGEWAVLSELCGTPWRPLTNEYQPADQMIL